jgi:hypothetical protein
MKRQSETMETETPTERRAIMSKVDGIRERVGQQQREVEARHRELLADAAVMFPTPAGRYILENGRWFIPQHRPAGVRKGSYKNCYNNAGNYVLGHPECTYVEGFAISGSAPVRMVMQHAWAGAGVLGGAGDLVIDRTWKDPEDSLYFGVSFDVVTWAALVHGREGWSLFHDGTVPPAIIEAHLKSTTDKATDQLTAVVMESYDAGYKEGYAAGQDRTTPDH